MITQLNKSGTKNLRLLPGQALRWYLQHARHPLKNYLVGHYWRWFEKPRVWVQYDQQLGIKLCLRDYVQQEIFFHSYYERALVEWLKCNLQPNDIFWDVGANIGALTLVAAPRCRQVVAFEPDPRSFKRLRENIAFNQLTNVELVPSALGDVRGEVTLHQAAESNTGMTSIVAGKIEPVGQVRVSMRRADEFLAEHPILTPTIIKLDVEGAEHLVLQGAPVLLVSKQVRAILFEDRIDETGQPTNAALQECLRAASYVYHVLGASDERHSNLMRNFLATREPSTP